MANSNVANFIINLTGNAKKQMDKVGKAFAVAKAEGKAAATAAEKFSENISGLKIEVAALEHRRMFAKTRGELEKIAEVSKKAKRELKQLENYPPDGFFSRLKKAGEALTGLRVRDIGGIFAVSQVKRFVGASMGAYDQQAKAHALLRSGLEATGYAAGRSFGQLQQFASKGMMDTLFSDTQIAEAQNRMLGFTNIKGDVFDKSMALSMDYAARKGMTLTNAVEQLGKSLNEPARYLNQLGRAGITFAKDVEEQVKALDASGNKEAAQLILLTELQKRYGGAAKEAALAGMGPWQQLMNMWNEFKGKIGGTLLDTVNRIVPALKNTVTWLGNHGNALKATAKVVGVAASAYLTFKLAQAGAISASKLLTTTVNLKTAVMNLYIRVVKGATVATRAFNAAQKANMIGLVVAGITAATAAFIAFRKRAKDASREMREAKEVAAGYYAQERSQLDQLFAKLRQTNPATAERKRLVQELANAYPELNKQQLQDLKYTNNLTGAYNSLIEAIGRRAKTKAYEKISEGLYEQMSPIDMQIDRIADGDTSKRKRLEKQLESGVGSWDFFSQFKWKGLKPWESQMATTKARLSEWREARKKAKAINKSIADMSFTPGGGGTGGDDGSGSGVSSSLGQLTSGGRSVKNIHITVHDGFIKEVTNNFSAIDDTHSMESFTDKLRVALMGVLNDANYIVD